MTSYIQCHNKPVLVITSKPPDLVKYIYDGQNYDTKIRMNIWTSMDVIPVEYGSFDHTFHLTMWFFQFINGINFKWNYLLWRFIALLVWIGLWTKLRIYEVSPDPVIWSCQCFRSLWQAFTLTRMLGYKNDLKVYHRKKVNDPSNMKLVTFLMNF